MPDTEKKCDQCGHLESEHVQDQKMKRAGGAVVETFRGECKQCPCPMFKQP
jgi:hypothetical protein